ncbi:unnamed protein product [Acanthoscelides obtectus]|uniref:Zinc finger PHD-type domain-containing protein n=1 Tax=Acanthoscelides obtectus TaxID=200917 RepID=A0A9P0NVS2_ACAOB|nr:unnamed protein product [Acanthoscelides obtectus]CAK1667935.1 hypothetical protein AOBTE_LOCUS26124 [Acanthoscelides obtectus]
MNLHMMWYCLERQFEQLQPNLVCAMCPYYVIRRKEKTQSIALQKLEGRADAILIRTPAKLLQVHDEATPTSSEFVKVVFSPENVRPFSKAPPRKGTMKGRKKRKSAIYTDTPEKIEIEKEVEEREKKRVKRNLGSQGNRPNNKVPRKKKTGSAESSEDENEYFCLVCVEPYGNSRKGEKWIQCTQCKMWSHEECVGQNLFYVCHNCESE